MNFRRGVVFDPGDKVVASDRVPVLTDEVQFIGAVVHRSEFVKVKGPNLVRCALS